MAYITIVWRLTCKVRNRGSSDWAVAELNRQPIGLTDTSEGSGNIAFPALHAAVAIGPILENEGRQSGQ